MTAQGTGQIHGSKASGHPCPQQGDIPHQEEAQQSENLSPSQIIPAQLEREENYSYCPERGNLAQVTQSKAAQGGFSNLNKTWT